VRICSLLPAATEIVGALGLADRLVGRSAECDWPPGVSALPIATAARIDMADMSSAQIDRAVRDAIADGRSLYGIDAELVEALAPDLLITQDTCEVCAVASGDVRRLCAIDADVLSLDARTIAGIEETVIELAQRLDVPDRGEAVVADMRRRVERVRELVGDLEPRRVFVAEWLDPPFAAGHWVPEMVEAAGGIEVLGRAGQPSYPTTWEEVAAAEPELIVVAPCGFDAKRAAAEARGISLPAPAVAVDANAYFSRPAQRIAEGVEQLGFLVHPNVAPDPGLPYVQVSESAAPPSTTIV
jgi:iron complex transport system substrate-binding protein